MEQVHDLLETLPPTLAYSVLFLTTLLENLFPPFPGDTFTLVGAYLVGIGTLGFWWTYLITTGGSLTGFLILYLLGMYCGRQYFYRKNCKYLNRDFIKEVEALFQRRGVLLIALNRFFSGIRAIISLVAGIAKYDWRVVAGLGSLSCILWNGIVIYAGSKVGEHWEKVMHWLRQYNIVVFLILGIFFIL
ncbi:MAG TPA: DedA family protein [bacterium]|nr:DedA family protein [bacterium]